MHNEYEPFTAREKEVLILVALGLSAENVAERLGVAATVRGYISNARSKLNACNSTHTVERALKHDEITHEQVEKADKNKNS